MRDKFSAINKNELWIAGQKHGGIMVPYLMAALDQWTIDAKAQDPNTWTPNLKGQIIANGFTDWKYDGFPAYFKMSFYHGLIDDELYEQGKENCNFTYIEVNGATNFSPVCKNTLMTFLNYTRYANTWDIYGKCNRD